MSTLSSVNFTDHNILITERDHIIIITYSNLGDAHCPCINYRQQLAATGFNVNLFLSLSSS